MNTKTIITEKMTYGGNCIAKIDGKTVFVPFALPEEELEVEITNTRRDYDSAKIVSVKTPSPHRIDAPCPHYGVCGGCNMQHIAPDFQKELRKGILKECFERNGVTPPEIAVIHGRDFAYRCRFRFSDGGLEARSSNAVVPIEKCMVAEDCINDWLSSVPFENRPRGKCRVFGSGKMLSSADGKNVIAAADEVKSRNAAERESKSRRKNVKPPKKRYEGTLVSPEHTAKVALLGKEIEFDVRGFFQSNLEMLEKTAEVLCAGLSGKSALDMYAGAGTFSVFLADIFENLTLVEHNRDAAVFAAKNLAGKNARIHGVSGAAWAAQNAALRFDAAVIDPPRSGIEKETLSYFCCARIPDLRCLSCDPSTHARDAAALIKAGYRLKKLFLLDFYPNTSHIESLGLYAHE
ncbi:MAG: class I SAM-dependent RNA methyltransferase [Treponema sp.]